MPSNLFSSNCVQDFLIFLGGDFFLIACSSDTIFKFFEIEIGIISVGVPHKAQLSFRLFVNFFVYWTVLRNSTKILYALKGI